MAGGGAALVRPASAATMIFGTQTFAIGARQRTIPDNFVTDSTNNSMNCRMKCIVPASGNILGLQLALPGFGFINPETVLPAAYTATVAIEYPAGVFTPVTVNGSRTMSVTPSKQLYYFDFTPISIPAGAEFWLKTYVQWSGTFWLTGLCACVIPGDWTYRGVGLTDQTLTTTTFLPQSPAGFGPVCYAAFDRTQNALVVLGDSIAFAAADVPQQNTNYYFIERAMAGQIPVLNTARSGDSMGDLANTQLCHELLAFNRSTRVLCEMGGNDIFGGTSAATLQTTSQTVWAPWLAQGFKVWQSTIPPRTTSTDNWATTANQTLVSAPYEAQRLIYNAWIRANWQSLGLSGYFDFAHAVDPTDSGKWSVDGTAGMNGVGFCTLTGGATTACDIATWNLNGTSRGYNYPTNTTLDCVVRPYAGDTGTVPTITATTNGSGYVSAFNIVSAGSGLTYPPMVAAKGSWTVDGVHPSARGFNEMIYQTGLVPSVFA